MNILRSQVVFLSFSIIFAPYLTAMASADKSLEQAFTSVYENRVWGSDSQGYGTSGSGSAVRAAQPYMNFLQDFLKTHAIKSVVDVGCGD